MEAVMTSKRLYKSRTERMVDGVCGGIAEYLGLDVTLIRILWVLLTLFGGTGIILYIVAMIVMPAAPPGTVAPGAPVTPRSHGANGKFWGAMLIAFGTLLLLDNIGIPIWHHWWGFSWSVVLPLLLILAGVAFLYGGRNGIMASPEPKPVNDAPGPEPAAAPEPAPSPRTNRLYRSRADKKILGVCGGIANHIGTDPTIVRLLFVIAGFASFGFMILLYLAMAIVVPQEPIVPVTNPVS
jgi:phage shock protein PspC (stress-responsive transcriptional regulator)